MNTFLFAVVRDVQRNGSSGRRRPLLPRWSFYSLSCETYSGTSRMGSAADILAGFYSLSCETYSGTVWGLWGDMGGITPFLFAVVRDVQRNDPGTAKRSFVSRGFLFAVVRDVQRNACPASTPPP